MDAAVEVGEVLRLVLQVHDAVLEGHLLLQERDPARGVGMWEKERGFDLVKKKPCCARRRSPRVRPTVNALLCTHARWA